jgi:hypothetical protein
LRAAPLALLTGLGVAAPTLAWADQAPLPLAVDGLPGLDQVALPRFATKTFAFSLSGGYGYTEAQAREKEGHHRASGGLGAGLLYFPSLAFGVSSAFRYDKHPSDARGGDDGGVLDLRLAARRGAMFGAHALGLELAYGAPGSESIAGGLGHPRLDARALYSLSLASNTLLGLNLGYRFDDSAGSVNAPTQLRRGDRVALGLSEYDALLLGLGVDQFFGKSEVFCEFSADFLIETGAPPLFQSPFRAALGFRQHLSDSSTVGLIVSSTFSDRAPSEAADPLVPVEPRLNTRFLYSIALGPSKANVPAIVQPKPVEEKPVEEKPAPPPAEVPPPPEPRTGSIQIVVTDFRGHPISDANVVAEITKAGETEPVVVVIPLRERNVYEAPDLPLGDTVIVVRAELLRELRQPAKTEAGKAVQTQIQLEKAAAGTLLRGYVRAFSGESVPATIRITPGDHTIQCDSDGAFQMEVPPGTYEVSIEAPGFLSQKRRLSVTKDGVTLLNVDLQKN